MITLTFQAEVWELTGFGIKELFIWFSEHCRTVIFPWTRIQNLFKPVVLHREQGVRMLGDTAGI